MKSGPVSRRVLF